MDPRDRGGSVAPSSASPVPRVLTVTMNPALDNSFTVPRLTPHSKMRCSAHRVDPGGGGVNVARFLHLLGEDVLALLPVAGYVGKALLELLDREGVKTAAVPIGGETRESHHVTDLETGLQYRFVLPGPTLGAREQERCLEAVSAYAGAAEFVVLSGSLPPGVPAGFVATVSDEVARAGARLVLDTSGDALVAARGAFLLKPSVRELEEILDRRLESLSAQVRGAHELLDRVQATALLLSRGNEGVVVVTEGSAVRVPAHHVHAVSTVGAGDALVAGTVFGLRRGWDLPRAARFGVACSTAMIGTVGTSLFELGSLAELSDELSDELAAPARPARVPRSRPLPHRD